MCPRAAAGPIRRELVVSRRRAVPGRIGRSMGCPQKQSSPYIRKVQYTVLSVDGLKGTMSEAELHLLRARLRGGALNKAKRGELQDLYHVLKCAGLSPDGCSVLRSTYIFSRG